MSCGDGWSRERRWGRRWGGAGRDYAYNVGFDEFGSVFASVRYEGPLPEFGWPAALEPNCAAENVGLLHLSP